MRELPEPTSLGEHAEIHVRLRASEIVRRHRDCIFLRRLPKNCDRDRERSDEDRGPQSDLSHCAPLQSLGLVERTQMEWRVKSALTSKGGAVCAFYFRQSRICS